MSDSDMQRANVSSDLAWTQPRDRSAQAKCVAVIEVIYAATPGGSEMLALNLCKQWKARELPTRICCLYRSGPLTAVFEEEGIPYDLMDVERKPFPFKRWALLTKYFRHWRPRSIHVHHFGCLANVLIPAFLAGCFNVVYTEHSSYRLLQTRWMKRALPWAARVVKRVTCVSDTLCDLMQAELRVPQEKLVTIPNGVDTERFRPFVGNRDGDRPIRIGAVGRLVIEKDYENLLIALSLLHARRVRFQGSIVGDGHLASSLHRLTEDLRLSECVTFLGDRRDIPELMRDLDIFVLSSFSEGMPVAILEAMASGLPIVATAVGGIGELIRPGINGVLVEKQNPSALADAIERLASDPALRRQLGETARQEVHTRFSIENIAQRYAHYLGFG